MTSRNRIGFVLGNSKPEVIETEDYSVDGNLLDLRSKIADMTIYLASNKYAKLTEKTKIAKLLDYNMLIQIEYKLSNL